MIGRRAELFAAAAFVVLIGLLILQEIGSPITPSEDDCLARGRPDDCWRDTGKEAYDLRKPPR